MFNLRIYLFPLFGIPLNAQCEVTIYGDFSDQLTYVNKWYNMYAKQYSKLSSFSPWFVMSPFLCAKISYLLGCPGALMWCVGSIIRWMRVPSRDSWEMGRDESMQAFVSSAKVICLHSKGNGTLQGLFRELDGTAGGEWQWTVVK